MTEESYPDSIQRCRNCGSRDTIWEVSRLPGRASLKRTCCGCGETYAPKFIEVASTSAPLSNPK